MLRKIKEYTNDDEFRLTILNNKIDIINYDEIASFSSTKIVVRHRDKKVVIEGLNLVITKMYDDELLIEGTIEGLKL